MDISQELPMDEISWSSSPLAEEMNGIHTDSILHYFAASPFFDATSNNATLRTQSMYNPNLLYLKQSREAFEARLKTMQGLEFMVTSDPSDNGRQQENNGVWVIRKQIRRKQPGYEDEITPISSYCVLGMLIIMAPSVGNVIGSRLLSTVTSLTKLLSAASTLPTFTPSLGNVYIMQAAKNPTSGSSTQLSQQSKESTPMPGTQSTSPGAKGPASAKLGTDSDYKGMRTFAESYNLALRYNGGYMDDNPLVGEPGSFILSRSWDTAVQSSQPKTVAQTRTPTLALPPIEIPKEPVPLRKGSKGGEKSPITPGTKEKKVRRKSKIAMSTSATTPKSIP